MQLFLFGELKMQFIYEYNGLPFFTEEEIRLKNQLIDNVQGFVKKLLLKQNSAWKFFQIEAPCLIPRILVNANYTDEDLWAQRKFHDNQEELVLKPETTPSSYLYMEHLLKNQLTLPPLVVWQVSKSFRREQDQPTKHCRFKEFYQQEFQCLYSSDTKNNYQEAIIEDLAQEFMGLLAMPTRLVLSDRLPDYSLKTIDIEVFNEDKWMEICSVSLRKDFQYKPLIKSREMNCLVLEIALGIDRLIYNISKRNEVLKLKLDNQLK